MRKFVLSLLFSLLLIGVFPVIGSAQTNTTLREEAIVSYTSNIVVNVDNSIDVTETIVYNTGPSAHHGIYRDIYPYSSQDRKMNIERVTVVNEVGQAQPFKLSSGTNTRIKIGDPDTTFTGQRVYVIRYHATRAIAQFKDFDEIYWNVTGNEWGMPIYEVEASVTLPTGATLLQSACYFGPAGSTNKCGAATVSGNEYVFKAPGILNGGEGITIAAGFPKGIVTPYSAADAAAGFWETYWRWLAAALLPILTFIFSLRSWYKKGRDDRETGTIIPQYDVPDNLTPMEVGGIVSEKVDTTNISAEIIYLATKGYLKIRQLEEGHLMGLIKSTDYELTKLKEGTDLLNDFDQRLLNGLFNPGPKIKMFGNVPVVDGVISTSPDSADPSMRVVKLSDLQNVFYAQAATVVKSVLGALLNKGYYKNLGRMKSGGNSVGRLIFIIFMAVWTGGFFGTFLGTFLFKGNPFPLMVGIFLSVIIYGLISQFSPSKTEKGVIAKEHLLGLEEYLQIAEKDRLLFHNAPAKNPEVFEKLLPYAMILGVADIWAKEFEGIYTAPPSWYSGSTDHAFSALAFSHSLSNFSTFANSSLSSSPSGSGSGGGGSSGGGGGGGGGGSW